MKKPPLERDIQRAILELLAYRRIKAWRVNQQGVPLHDGSGSFRKAPTRGMSDIIGVLLGGRFLAIEVKRPGGKTTKDQQEFLDTVNEAGGLAFVATSTADVEAQIGETR